MRLGVRDVVDHADEARPASNAVRAMFAASGEPAFFAAVGAPNTEFGDPPGPRRELAARMIGGVTGTYDRVDGAQW